MATTLKTTEDERAMRRLIRFYTARRDWFMVTRLMNDLGHIFGGGEKTEDEA